MPECGVCYSDVRESFIMNEVTGCPCGQKLCCICWMEIFDRKDLWIEIQRVEGGEPIAQPWRNLRDLTLHMFETHSAAINGVADTVEQFKLLFTCIHDNVMLGIKCPFCRRIALYQPSLYPKKIDGRIQFFAPTQRMPPLPENAIILGAEGFDQSEYINREDLGLNIQTIRDVVNGQPDDGAITAFIERGNQINEEDRQNQLTAARLLQIEQELHDFFREDENERS